MLRAGRCDLFMRRNFPVWVGGYALLRLVYFGDNEFHKLGNDVIN